jgi:dihydrofolate synthase/folylpolyglutamate synthase
MMDITKNKQPYLKDLNLDLGGMYQSRNICTVLQTAELLQEKGFELNRKNIRKGLASVRKSTGLAGRWQLLGKNPSIICDAGHNTDGIHEIVTQIAKTAFKKLHMVIGVVNDKDVSKMLALLPKKATYYFCKADIPRGMDSKLLKKEAVKKGLNGKSYASVNEALENAKMNAGIDDLIFIGGSTFVVAEVV